MNGMGPNLAARPFANERPVQRTTMLIWVLALGLLAINVYLYQRHLSGQHEQRQALQSLQDRIASEEALIRESEQHLATLDIDQQNEKIVFLNSEIAKRTFLWSLLFDRLEEVLPARVQLRRISPRVVQEKKRSSKIGEARHEDVVSVEITGYAPTSEDLFRFVDNLFEHPRFSIPNLMGESERDDGRLDFSLNVLYLPGTTEQEIATLSTGQVEAAAMRAQASEIEP